MCLHWPYSTVQYRCVPHSLFCFVLSSCSVYFTFQTNCSYVTSFNPFPQLRDAVSSLQYELNEKDREVQDRDDICEFLRAEIRKYDLHAKVQEEMLTKDAKCLLEQMTEKEAQIAEVRRNTSLCVCTCCASFGRMCATTQALSVVAENIQTLSFPKMSAC